MLFRSISPSAYEELLEQIWEAQVTPVIAKRLADLKSGKAKSIEVKLEDLAR